MTKAAHRFVDHWLVDPVAKRAGVATLDVEGSQITAVTWRDGEAAADAKWEAGANPGVGDPVRMILPALIDLHAHARQPGASGSEDVESFARAAAHGGYGSACLMPNTEPAADSVEILDAMVRPHSGASLSMRLLPIAAATVGRRGEQVAPLAALVAAGAVACSDDGAPIADPRLFAEVLAAAATAGIPLIEHSEDPVQSADGEAADGAVALRLGLRPWPARAEHEAVARNITILREVAARIPRARLHLTHLSTAASLQHVRAAQASGLQVTCDVTPHHLALSDAWLMGEQRWSWLPGDDAISPSAAAFNTNLRVCPPLRAAVDGAACRAALRDGTACAIATDHAPHSRERKEVEFGRAANGIAGIETSLSVALAAQAAGELSLATLVAALTTGPAALLEGKLPAPTLSAGAPASLVVVDRLATWVPARANLLGRSINTPLLGVALPGVVRLTLHAGATAYSG